MWRTAAEHRGQTLILSNTAHATASSMLNTDTASLADFLQVEQQWQQGPVTLMLARFDKNCYQAALFDQAQLPWPDMLNNAVVKRQAEYLAGRYCIRMLQRQLGLATSVIFTAPDRSPVWPSGQLGSLSHTDGWVLAALQPTSELQDESLCWLGVDIEQLFSTEQQQSIAAMIHHNDELQLGRQAGLCDCQLSTLAFSAKESLYKALSVYCQRIMEFTAARLVAVSSQHFVLELTENWSVQWPAGRQLQGQYRWFGSLLCCWLTTTA